MKIWLAIGIVTIPVGTILFGLMLKPIIKVITRISIKQSRSFYIQLCVLTAGWFSLLISILIGLTGISHDILWMFNLILSIIIGAFIYSAMIKNPDKISVGFKKGFLVSIAINAIALLLDVPLKLLNINV